MTVIYPDGNSTEAIILNLSGGVMRVAMKDCADAIEFKLVAENWVSEDLQPVLFDFPLSAVGALLETAQPDPSGELPEQAKAC